MLLWALFLYNVIKGHVEAAWFLTGGRHADPVGQRVLEHTALSVRPEGDAL